MAADCTNCVFYRPVEPGKYGDCDKEHRIHRYSNEIVITDMHHRDPSLNRDDSRRNVCEDFVFDPTTKMGDSNNSNNASSGCFLTSACVDALGKPDDCYELSTLRKFRDEWLAVQENGKADIARYYELAPKVVDEINRSSNSKEVYSGIYQNLVTPCVKMIEEGRLNDTWDHYRMYSEDLFSEYALGPA